MPTFRIERASVSRSKPAQRAYQKEVMEHQSFYYMMHKGWEKRTAEEESAWLSKGCNHIASEYIASREIATTRWYVDISDLADLKALYDEEKEMNPAVWAVLVNYEENEITIADSYLG